MRCFLLLLCSLLFLQTFSQSTCRKNSRLYWFDTKYHPQYYTEKLGRHPQFPFLQQVNGITTAPLFIKSINNAGNQEKYAREFKAFDLLLHNSGFENGYKDLSEANVQNTFVPRKTIGNLGFYDKAKDRMDYIYVRLNPAGEPPPGVAAWKLTNAHGCSLYILHTCGNAFYPAPEPSEGGASPEGAPNSGEKGLAGIPHSGGGGQGCCRTITIESGINPADIKKVNDTPTLKPLHIRFNLYEGRISRSGKKKDTAFTLIHHVDTIKLMKDIMYGRVKIHADPFMDRLLICKDTLLKLFTHISMPDQEKAAREMPQYVFSDTVYLKNDTTQPVCANKWEISLDGGVSVNSIPRFDNPAVHSQTDGSHLAAEFAISRIFKPWFQAGLSASYIVLAYQDDIVYAGSAPGTYNTIYLGKPLIPVQLFGKFTIGKPKGWQSNISLSAGYAIATGDKIENSGTTLAAKPNTKGGLTAGFKMGVAYFFTCKFGLGASFSGQYFGNKSDLTDAKLFALPIMGGIRIRF